MENENYISESSCDENTARAEMKEHLLQETNEPRKQKMRFKIPKKVLKQMMSTLSKGHKNNGVAIEGSPKHVRTWMLRKRPCIGVVSVESFDDVYSPNQNTNASSVSSMSTRSVASSQFCGSQSDLGIMGGYSDQDSISLDGYHHYTDSLLNSLTYSTDESRCDGGREESAVRLKQNILPANSWDETSRDNADDDMLMHPFSSTEGYGGISINSELDETENEADDSVYTFVLTDLLKGVSGRADEEDISEEQSIPLFAEDHDVEMNGSAQEKAEESSVKEIGFPLGPRPAWNYDVEGGGKYLSSENTDWSGIEGSRTINGGDYKITSGMDGGVPLICQCSTEETELTKNMDAETYDFDGSDRYFLSDSVGTTKEPRRQSDQSSRNQTLITSSVNRKEHQSMQSVCAIEVIEGRCVGNGGIAVIGKGEESVSTVVKEHFFPKCAKVTLDPGVEERSSLSVFMGKMIVICLCLLTAGVTVLAPQHLTGVQNMLEQFLTRKMTMMQPPVDKLMNRIDQTLTQLTISLPLNNDGEEETTFGLVLSNQPSQSQSFYVSQRNWVPLTQRIGDMLLEVIDSMME